jgi:hypothetical protein
MTNNDVKFEIEHVGAQDLRNEQIDLGDGIEGRTTVQGTSI